MFKPLTLAATMLALSSAALIPATPAAAQRYDQRGYQNGRGQDRYYNDGRYSDRGDYRRYKKCKRQGDAGTIIGAIAGGLLGRALPGNNTTGTIVGAGAGALAGRAIDKGDRPGYCR